MMPAATRRRGLRAHEDEIARLREQVQTLTKELARARRCLWSERAGREALRVRLLADASASDVAINILCRVAFPRDGRKGGA